MGKLLDIEPPIGDFILKNLPLEKRFQTANGLYIHYEDVCTLLKSYAKEKLKSIAEQQKDEVIGLKDEIKKYGDMASAMVKLHEQNESLEKQNKALVRFVFEKLLFIHETDIKTILAEVDSNINNPILSTTFGDNWKSNAANNYTKEMLIDIAWVQGRRGLLLERELRIAVSHINQLNHSLKPN